MQHVQGNKSQTLFTLKIQANSGKKKYFCSLIDFLVLEAEGCQWTYYRLLITKQFTFFLCINYTMVDVAVLCVTLTDYIGISSIPFKHFKIPTL